MFQKLIESCWEQMNLKNSLYNIFQGGVISLLCPSAFYNPLCSSNNLLGRPEPSIRPLTTGLEKMTQALSPRCHFLLSIAEANLPINPGLGKCTYVSFRKLNTWSPYSIYWFIYQQFWDLLYTRHFISSRDIKRYTSMLWSKGKFSLNRKAELGTNDNHEYEERAIGTRRESS